MATKEVNDQSDLFNGFSKLDRRQRLMRLHQMGAISKEDVQFLLDGSPLDLSLAENLIENVVGYFQIPVGVAANFVIDRVSRPIPMAVEETSIIAAAS